MDTKNNSMILPFQFFSPKLTVGLPPCKEKYKPELGVIADAPIIEMAKKIVAAYLLVVIENKEGIKTDYDSEFLHDYRVNLRKIRSLLSLFKGVFDPGQNSRAKQDFSKIMKPTNRLRDLDVFLLEQQGFYELLPANMHKGLQQMFKAFVVERKHQLKQVSKMLNSQHYQQSTNGLLENFTASNNMQAGPKALTTSLDFARKLIDKHYNKIARIAKKIDQNTADEEIHQLRIECKKLRYLMEFFATFIRPKKLEKLITLMKSLQDNLGNFNDYSVQQDALHEFLNVYSKKYASQNVIMMVESIGALGVLLHQKQNYEREKIIKLFSKFNKRKTKKKFKNIF